jgi:hypothetical protein
MNKDQVQDLILGVALVALGYAVWQHFKDKLPARSSNAAPATFTTNNPTKPDHGFGYDPYAPAEFLTVAELTRGTIADWFSGTKAALEIPTVDGLIAAETQEFYNVPERPGDFMRVGLW